MVDGSSDLADLQDVPDANGLIEDQRRAGDDVLQRLLRRQRDGNTADAQSGQRGCRIDREVAEHDEEADQDDDQVDGPSEHAQQRGSRGAVGARRVAMDVILDLAVEQNQQPDSRDNRDEAGGAAE